jgi:putative peptidoglycan lipid II flippase
VTSSGGGPLSLAATGRSALTLASGAAVAQAIGVIRELFLAAHVGLSSQLDALLIGIVLPVTLSGVLTSGAGTALVPAYADASATRGPAEAKRLAGTVLLWVGAGGLAVSLALIAFADVAVAITGPGLSDAGRASAAWYLRSLAPIAFVAALTTVLYGVCQAEGRFALMAAATVGGSAATLLVMLVLWDRLHLAAFAAGSLVGPVVTLLILLVAMIRLSLAPAPHVGGRGMALHAFARHAAPLTLSAGIMQLNVIGDRAIASLLAPGAVSALRYGEILIRLPIGTIGPAWAGALYPALVRSTHGAVSGLAAATDTSLRYALAVFVPIAALLAALAPVVAALAYGRGAFAASDVALTAHVVAGFAPLLVILMTSPVLAGALNARRSGMVLLIGGSLNVVLNLLLDLAFGVMLGVAGVALASSVSSTIVSIFFARRLARSEAGLRLPPLARTVFLAILSIGPAAIASAAIAWSGLVPSGALPALVVLVVCGVGGMASYVVVATVVGLEEPRALVRLGVGRARRGRLSPDPAP